MMNAKGCRCVYCKGTRENLADYAAELEMLAAHQAEALKRFGCHDGNTCGFVFKKGKPKTLKNRIGVDVTGVCNCGLEEAIQVSANGYDRLHQLAGSYRCSPSKVRARRRWRK